MRKKCLDCVYELARQDERVVFIGSDLGIGTLDQFKNDFPDRFFMEGVSEANIVGMAAGLALEGRIVYVNTIATFITRRCFEQVVLDLGLHKAAWCTRRLGRRTSRSTTSRSCAPFRT